MEYLKLNLGVALLLTCNFVFKFSQSFVLRLDYRFHFPKQPCTLRSGRRNVGEGSTFGMSFVSKCMLNVSSIC
jgi:hypothetical protein